jgi:uncharacterized HTH-type transcriptional regulator yceK
MSHIAQTFRLVYKSCVTVELAPNANEPQDDIWDVETQAKVFKAISDPARLEILRCLVRAGRGITCGEVGAMINISKSAGSYHFRILREAGLTVTKKVAREKYVSANTDVINRYITGFIDNIKKKPTDPKIS